MQNAVFNIADEQFSSGSSPSRQGLLRCNERVMLAVLQTSETRTAYCESAANASNGIPAGHLICAKEASSKGNLKMIVIKRNGPLGSPSP